MTAAFGDTLAASRMRLHVSYDALNSNLLRWPGVERCSDLYVTLANDHVAPEWAIQWLTAEKTREGPLRLRVHTNRRESWHRHWEASAQRLLLVSAARHYREISIIFSV